MYEDSYSTLKKTESDFFDIYKEKTTSRVVEAKDGKIENIRIGVDGGAGVRIVKGLSTLFSSTCDTTEESVYKITKFLSNYNAQADDTQNNYALRQGSIESYGGLEENIESIKEIFDVFNDVAYSYSQVKQVSLTYSDSTKDIEIINEKGNLIREKRNYLVFYAVITAKKGDIIQTVRKPFGALGGFDYIREWSFKKIAKDFVEKLIELIDAQPLKAQNMGVVLSSNAGGTMIHEAVGHGLEADLVYESMSVYKDKLNTKVANEKISVVDDATRPFMRGSYSYDDEGEKAQNTLLIENGILKNYMFDKTYAKFANMQTTANSRRESFRYPPIVRMSNTYILPGNDKPTDIINSVDFGLFVKQMGGGQVNPITGDFVFEVAEGYLIKNGYIKDMVRGATLVGNGPKILNEIDMVGDDFGIEVGTCGKGGQGVPVSDGEPTIKIPSIMVGGSAL